MSILNKPKEKVVAETSILLQVRKKELGASAQSKYMDHRYAEQFRVAAANMGF